MIDDSHALQAVRDEWEFVRQSRNVLVGNCNAAAWVVGFNQRGIRDLGFNLLLASAFSVLEMTLLEFRDQGSFKSKDTRLRSLMLASRASVPWVDWSFVDAAREDRNNSIHHRAYLPHARCLGCIAAIEKELLAWGVLASATPELWHW